MEALSLGLQAYFPAACDPVAAKQRGCHATVDDAYATPCSACSGPKLYGYGLSRPAHQASTAGAVTALRGFGDALVPRKETVAGAAATSRPLHASARLGVGEARRGAPAFRPVRRCEELAKLLLRDVYKAEKHLRSASKAA